MYSTLRDFAADHRELVGTVARQVGISEPSAIDLDEFHGPLLKAARRLECVPIHGVLLHDWDPDSSGNDPRLSFGVRVYEIQGVRFAQICDHFQDSQTYQFVSFTIVDRANYRKLYRIARDCRRDVEPPGEMPILPADHLAALWKNTIEYLTPKNLRVIKTYGGRARRGVLLTGPPGNGKTMACRWIWGECRRRGWEWRLVTPDAYREARNSRCNIQAAVQALFTVERRGIVFFDDMDIALRDRDTVAETEDQAVFLLAIDGLNANEGVVHVFTSNCSLDLIDRAFKRPGRLDVVLDFQPPDAGLRRKLIERWHADMRANIDVAIAVESTASFSFAEIEELKNLLILHFMDANEWDWEGAMKQFECNRSELKNKRGRVGFDLGTLVAAHTRNGMPCNEDL